MANYPFFLPTRSRSTLPTHLNYSRKGITQPLYKIGGVYYSFDMSIGAFQKALQVGARKQLGNEIYELNQNHRWTRVDSDPNDKSSSRVDIPEGRQTNIERPADESAFDSEEFADVRKAQEILSQLKSNVESAYQGASQRVASTFNKTRTKLTESKSYQKFRKNVEEPLSAVKEGLSDIPEDMQLLLYQSLAKTIIDDSPVAEIGGAILKESPEKAKAITNHLKNKEWGLVISEINDLSVPLQKQVVNRIIQETIKSSVKSSSVVGAMATATTDVLFDYYEKVKEDNKNKENEGTASPSEQPKAHKEQGKNLKAIVNGLRLKAIDHFKGESGEVLLDSMEKQGLIFLAGLGANALFHAHDPTIGLGVLPSYNIVTTVLSGNYASATSSLLAATTGGAIGTMASNYMKLHRAKRKKRKT